MLDDNEMGGPENEKLESVTTEAAGGTSLEVIRGVHPDLINDSDDSEDSGGSDNGDKDDEVREQTTRECGSRKVIAEQEQPAEQPIVSSSNNEASMDDNETAGTSERFKTSSGSGSSALTHGDHGIKSNKKQPPVDSVKVDYEDDH